MDPATVYNFCAKLLPFCRFCKLMYIFVNFFCRKICLFVLIFVTLQPYSFNLLNFEVMEMIKKTEELFTLEEVAKWCEMSKGAIYMHYRRGHLVPENMACHRLYFRRSVVDEFRANYVPFTL